MASARESLRKEIAATIVDLKNRLPQDGNLNTQFGWNVPGTTRDQIVQLFADLIDKVDRQEEAEVADKEDAILGKSVEALAYLRANTGQYLTNGNANPAVSVYAITAWTLRDTLSALWPEPNQAEASQVAVSIRESKRRVRSMEVSLDGLQPRTESLETMVSRIEAANAAADSLPIEMADLREAKEELARLNQTAGEDYEQFQRQTGLCREHLAETETHVSHTVEELEAQLTKGAGLVEQLIQLHRIGTSTVLAGAFNERAKKLNSSVYVWLGVLMLALGFAAWFGHERAGILTDLMRSPNPATDILVVQTIIMLFGMGAPVWLGWVATKQIGQRFKLAEDYHYKASISNAYEGYRREAVELDGDFRRQLFQSALGRLDELPLRVMDQENHGSPAHELMNRPGFWSFMIQVFGGNRTAAADPLVSSKQPNSSLEKPTTE